MFFSQKSSQSQHQFNTAVMRSCKGSTGLSVAGPEGGPMFDDLYRELEGLHGLLMNENYREYINRSTALVKHIEDAESSFFQKKYTSDYPDLEELQINQMARDAARISDDEGLLLPMKLASLVQHWTAHPDSYGQTRPEFTEFLKQIASVSIRLSSHLQLQEVSHQLIASLQEQCEQSSMLTLAGP